jgi:hypothetical protein
MDEDYDMDSADKERKAPDPSWPSNVPGDNVPHQRSAPPAMMHAPHLSNTPSPSNILNLGTSVLGKRKATESPLPHNKYKSTTDDDPQQTSPEQPVDFGRVTPTTSVKKRRFKSEFLEQKRQDSLRGSSFLGPNETSTVLPDRTLAFRRGTLSEVDSCIAEFQQQMHQIEHEQAEVRVARSHSVGGLSDRRVEPYDTNMEKKASMLSIDLPNFSKAKRMGGLIVDIVLETVNLLDEVYGELHDPEVSIFCQKLKSIIAPRKYTRHARSVGLISDPGVGKSILICNLLNVLPATISKSSRNSTTNVRHEYIHAESQLSAPSVAVVHLFDAATIDNKIRDRVAKVLDFKTYDRKGETFEKGMYDDLEQKSSIAMEYLASLVVAPGASPGFQEVAELEQYMMTESGIGESEIVRHLSDCVQSYRVSLAGATNQIRFEACSLGAIQGDKKFQRFAGYKKDPLDPHTPWRLVDKISMYASSLVLENGLRLNDVPGINVDTDQSRIETGVEAYRSCDIIILLKPYERSTSNQTLLDTFSECIRNGTDVVLGITHLDSFDNNDDLADEEEFDEELEKLITLEQEVQEADEYDEEEHLSIVRSKHLRRIAIRAEAITNEMQTTFRDLQVKWNGCEGAKLKVFPLLNKDHICYVKGYSLDRLPESQPKVPIEDTGIIPLRTFLRSKPAEMMLRTLTLSNADLDRFLLAIHLYCISSKLERKKDIQDFVEEPQKDCAKEAKSVVEALKNDIDTVMEDVIFRHKITWKERGEELCETWGGKQHNNYLAFCKKMGDHHTAGNRESWNDDIQKIILVDLVAAKKLVDDTVKRRKAELLQHVVGLMNNIVTKMQGKWTIIFRGSGCSS